MAIAGVKAENMRAKQKFPRGRLCMISSIILAAPMLCCIHENLKAYHGMPIVCYDFILWIFTCKALILCCNIMIVAVLTRSESLKISWGIDDSLHAEYVRNERVAGPSFEDVQTEGNSEEQIKCTCWEPENSMPEPSDEQSRSLVFLEASAPQGESNADHMMMEEELQRRFDDFIAKIKCQIRKGV